MRKAAVEVFFDTHIQDVCIENKEIKSIKISKEILSVYNESLLEDVNILS